MTAPTSYDATSLAQMMVEELGEDTADSLGLIVTSPLILRTVTAVVRLLGVEIAAATDMALLEAGARWKVWEAALSAAITSTNLKAGTAALEEEQIFQHIKDRLALARSAWFIELARSQTAAGGAAMFAFGLAGGSRGR